MIIGNIYDIYDVDFPIHNKLNIIIGPNGSYKTCTLNLLYNFYISNNENVLFFESDRYFNINNKEQELIKSWLLLDSLNQSQLTLLKNIDFKYDFINYGDYINSGKAQLLNFYYQIKKNGKNAHVIIDFPEKNLDIYSKRKFISFFKDCNDIKTLTIVTHSPEIISSYRDYIIDIKNILKRKER